MQNKKFVQIGADKFSMGFQFLSSWGPDRKKSKSPSIRQIFFIRYTKCRHQNFTPFCETFSEIITVFMVNQTDRLFFDSPHSTYLLGTAQLKIIN